MTGTGPGTTKGGLGHLAAVPAAVFALLAAAPPARAQDIEPRAYSNAPVGVNFLITGFAWTRGGVAFDPSLPVENPQLHTSSAVLAYARVLKLGGTSGKVDAIVPYTWLSGSADWAGERVERVVDGLADARVRVSINLHGAPALTRKEFAAYRQDLIVGVSLQVGAPTGRVDEDRLVNIGSNRWSFKSEAGVSKTVGRWTLEGAAAVTLFTVNHEFFGGRTRAQDPIFSVQGHAILGTRKGIWGALDATWFTGGRTTLDGLRKDDRQENWRVGGTLAFPVTRLHSIKLYGYDGVSSRTGNSNDLIAIAWQVRWGGGL